MYVCRMETVKLTYLLTYFLCNDRSGGKILNYIKLVSISKLA